MENKNSKKTEFEDIYSDSKTKPTYKKGHKPLEERDIYYPNKFLEFLLKDRQKNLKRILIAIFAVLLLIAVFSLWMFYSGMFDKMLSESEGWQGDENYTENFEENQFEAMHEVSNADSLDDLLKKWYNNDGSIMDQDYIVNILLLGIDGKNGVKNGGNSDSMILVSVNKKTEKITMISFMRDSRTYFEVNGKGYWTKANAAFAKGGAKATVKMIENNYKVDIDYYVAVDFTTFSDLVDALGGVTLNIEEYEQKYINRTTSKIKKIPNYGTVTLDGDQALVYCRIRKSDADSDVSRTRRQRNFVSSLIRSAKGATISQLNNAVEVVLPHLHTDCSKTKVLGFAGQALAQGWMNYEILQVTMPDQDTRADANINGISYWVVDYPLAAQRVQLAIYGTTNIQIGSDRESSLDYVHYNNNNSSSGNNNGSSESYTVTEPDTSSEAETTDVTSTDFEDNTELTEEYTSDVTEESETSEGETTTEKSWLPNFPWNDDETPAEDTEEPTLSSGESQDSESEGNQEDPNESVTQVTDPAA
ncbi:MAG: LCP family protein [Clostridia bacterium]|nr:LCP family protein [Clostridia bacterium]